MSDDKPVVPNVAEPGCAYVVTPEMKRLADEHARLEHDAREWEAWYRREHQTRHKLEDQIARLREDLALVQKAWDMEVESANEARAAASAFASLIHDEIMGTQGNYDVEPESLRNMRRALAAHPGWLP